MLDPNGKIINDNGNKLKPQDEQGKEVPELRLTIIWKENGMALEGCIKNEVASLYMLEKAKDLIKRINAPQIMTAKLHPKHNILNFMRKRR